MSLVYFSGDKGGEIGSFRSDCEVPSSKKGTERLSPCLATHLGEQGYCEALPLIAS